MEANPKIYVSIRTDTNRLEWVTSTVLGDNQGRTTLLKASLMALITKHKQQFLTFEDMMNSTSFQRLVVDRAMDDDPTELTVTPISTEEAQKR